MSDKNPMTGRGRPKTLLCEEWEALLVDALDGQLVPTESAAFAAHRDTCLACARLLEESKRGSEWLHFLDAEPEVPADLVNRILAQTSGAVDAQPAVIPTLSIPGMPPLAVPAGTGWRAGWLPMMERHAAQSRWMMTAAMAFFSIAFTLNLTGVKLTGLHLADLRPATIASSLTRQFYVADAHVMRYYDNLRFVYEVQSRVREMRRDTEPAAPKASPGAGDKKPAVKHTDGSAERRIPAATPLPVQAGEPVMAKFEKKIAGPHAELVLLHGRTQQEQGCEQKKMRAERSLA